MGAPDPARLRLGRTTYKPHPLYGLTPWKCPMAARISRDPAPALKASLRGSERRFDEAVRLLDHAVVVARGRRRDLRAGAALFQLFIEVDEPLGRLDEPLIELMRVSSDSMSLALDSTGPSSGSMSLSSKSTSLSADSMNPSSSS